MEEDIKIQDLIEHIRFGTQLKYDMKTDLIAIENLIARYKKLENEYKVLREYVNFAPNLDEMSATKYKEICQSAYIKGRQDERNRAKEIIEETCIPKSKVIETIKELEYGTYDAKIILQQLLED